MKRGNSRQLLPKKLIKTAPIALFESSIILIFFIITDFNLLNLNLLNTSIALQLIFDILVDLIFIHLQSLTIYMEWYSSPFHLIALPFHFYQALWFSLRPYLLRWKIAAIWICERLFYSLLLQSIFSLLHICISISYDSKFHFYPWYAKY